MKEEAKREENKKREEEDRTKRTPVRASRHLSRQQVATAQRAHDISFRASAESLERNRQQCTESQRMEERKQEIRQRKEGRR